MNTNSFVFQNTKLFKGSLRENSASAGKSRRRRNQQALIFPSEKLLTTSAGLIRSSAKGTYLSGANSKEMPARAMVKNAPILLLMKPPPLPTPKMSIDPKSPERAEPGQNSLMTPPSDQRAKCRPHPGDRQRKDCGGRNARRAAGERRPLQNHVG